jgi:L-aspartate oxidase
VYNVHLHKGAYVMADCQSFDVAIIGGGIAGLSVALRLPEHLRVALFTKGQLGESNTRYAQGGLAVALGADDSPQLHFQDTIAAGAGLCDEEAVRILVEQAPAAVRWLIQMGVQFDRAQVGSDVHTTPDGLLLGREGAHSRWRVLHAGGDATGAEIERALMNALRARSSIVVYEETFVYRLLVENDVCVGIEALDRDGHPFTIESHVTVLANGGAGGLWLHTSNPSGATADGLALAWNAGAAVIDLEFMQFHPTVLVANGTSHLISEAVRGEGAYLRNHAGERFMPRYSSQAELAPRDVVARAILSEMLAEQTEYQYLDLRHLPAEKMHARFPTISAICRQHGLDLVADLLPIAPAAHYCMGGVLVDTYGRTTLAGLYAVGEVACTGVHGANRLASNSLLEGLVYGVRVADGLAGLNEHTVIMGMADAMKSAPTIPLNSRNIALIPYITTQEEVLSSGNADEHIILETRRHLRQLMWEHVSLHRNQEGLLEAKRKIHALRKALPQSNVGAHFIAPASPVPHSECDESHPYNLDAEMHRQLVPRLIETTNMLQVAELVIAAALERCESRGSHWRQDYQLSDERLAKHHHAFQRMKSQHAQSTLSQKEVIAHV